MQRKSVGQARWKVAWASKGKIILKDYGADFQEALRIYELAKTSGRKAVTLVSANYAFDPPEELQPKDKKFVKRTKVKRNGRTRVKKEIVERRVIPMAELNLQGIWWCPYCIKKRKFIFKSFFRHEGQKVNAPGYYCPVCGVSHNEWSVRRWNPVGNRLRDEPGKLMKSGKTRSRRRTSKTKSRRSRAR